MLVFLEGFSCRIVVDKFIARTVTHAYYSVLASDRIGMLSLIFLILKANGIFPFPQFYIPYYQLATWSSVEMFKCSLDLQVLNE